MKPYSINPAKTHATKYARKAKSVPTRVVIERQHRKSARRSARLDVASRIGE